jgi:glyoxylase-like metal-dependent hydrolase (beta-lactamase superfamily II)
MEPARLVCHCLALETDDGLVLVDTGLGLEDIAHPSRLSPAMRIALRPRLRVEETAAMQLERLGFRREDVRHVVLTHLDFDHAGGLADFPTARVHVLADELLAARDRATHAGPQRYRPAQWAHQPRWVTYEVDDDSWFGLPCVRGLEGVRAEVLLVPLFGHTPGHCGVAVRTDRGWLLHAGDAYYHHAELDPDSPHCPPGLALYQSMMEWDRELRRRAQAQLRELSRVHGNEVRIFCSHDPEELTRMQLLAAEEPARAPRGPELRAP